MRHLAARRLLLAAALVAGCTVPDATFVASTDSGIDAPVDRRIVLDPADQTVEEGHRAQLAVRLDPEPALDVTIRLAVTAGVALDTTTVTVGPGHPTATVELTALDDADAQNLSAQVTATGDGLSATARVQVDDDEEQGLLVDFGTLDLPENGSGQLAVTLAAQPLEDITVEVSSADTAIATVTPGQLVFRADDWDQPHRVDVVGVRDPDVIDESVAIAFRSPPLEERSTLVRVLDIDHQGIATDEAMVTVVEGSPGSPIHVHLNQEPVGELIVDVAAQDPRVHVLPTSLRFDATDFNLPKVVTVTLDQDDDVASFVTSVRLTTSTPGVDPRAVGVTATDDDHQAIVLAAAQPFRVGEHATAAFTARLAFRPADDVTVGLASLDETVATVAPGALTFTGGAAGDWNLPRQVVVTGVDDVDVVDDATIVRLSGPGLDTVDLDTTVDDEDTVTLAITGAPVTVTEGGSAMFTFALTYQPPAPITVRLTSSDDAAVAITPPMIEIVPAEYATPRTVRLDAPLDGDLVDEQVNLTLASPGNLTAVTLSVTVDDQTTLGIVTTTGMLTAAEGGAVVPFGVSLSNPPLGPVRVDVASSNPRVRVEPTSLDFDPTDWMSPKEVRVTALVDDDVVNGAATLTLGGPGLPDKTVAVTTTDSDRVELVPSTAQVSVLEGTTTTLTVRLGHQPPAGLMVNLATLATTVATVMPDNLSFTTADWSQPQTVTITGVQDADLVAGATTLRLTSPGLTTVDVPVAVTDDDQQGIVIAGAPATMVEGGAQVQFTVRLTSQPVGDVTVNLGTSNAAAVAVGPPSMTFTSATWNQAKTATLTAPIDDDLVDGAATITLTSPGNAPPRSFDVVVDDPDVLTLVASTGAVAVTEGAAGVAVAVHLGKRPSGQVVVSASSSLAQLAGVLPASRTFDATNWNQDQSFTISAPVDDDTVGGMAIITLAAPTAVPPPAPVTVTTTVTDPDVQQILASTASLPVTEGATASFGVRLRHRPTADVSVSVTSLVPTVASVPPGALVFTAANWNLEQQVTVTGTQDDNLAAGATTVRLTAVGIATATDVAITVTDDDQQAIVLAGTPATMVEGGAQPQFTVRLAFQPAGDVQVTLTSSNQAAVSVAPGSMTFTSLTWNQPRTATLTAPVDDDLLDGAATITAASVSNAPSRSFDIAVDDPDVLTLVASTSTVNVTEGGAGVLVSVHLGKRPGGQVVVNASSGSLLASVGPGSRTFDAVNWNQDQTFTISAPVDDDTVGGQASITLSAPAQAPPPAPVTITANVTDPDVQAILQAAPNPLAVTEGGTASFGVRLKHRPAADVTVNVQSLAVGVATVSGNLTFTTANWNVDKQVTVTGVQDVNMVDGATSVRLTSLGLTTVDVPVAVDDDDVQAIDVSTSSVTVNEGSATTVNVSLRYQPAAMTTVTVTTTNGAKVGVSGNLTFQPATYNVAQAITITGLADSNTTDETGQIVLTNVDAPAATTINVTVHDVTIVTDVGWPTYFNTSVNMGGTSTLAYRITVGQAGKVDSFGVVTGAAGGDGKMALYADDGVSNAPGALVSAVDTATPLAAGTVLLDATDVPISAGVYWIALRVSPSASVGSSASVLSRRCSRNLGVFTGSWPATFGAATCLDNVSSMNVFVRTYRP